MQRSVIIYYVILVNALISCSVSNLVVLTQKKSIMLIQLCGTIKERAQFRLAMALISTLI